MVFSSLMFVFFFLPIVVVLYYLAKDRYRNYILLVASLLFYAYGEPRFVLVMIISIVINYRIARSIDDAKADNKDRMPRFLLFIDVFVNIGLLFVFKYLNYSLLILGKITGLNIPKTGIVLPIGISFFTFQALSYCIDVYRGTVRVRRSLFDVALYISFFPQLIAGPIVRYSTIEKELTDRKPTLEDFSEGVKRFFLGFAKKMIIANNLALVVKDVWDMDHAAVSSPYLWLGSICFSLQIFYDFSAYSDMAIGLGRMFGFRFEENFDYPYISKSVTEFWRRWHISLGRWFRDYVYIPLGGSRVSALRVLVNLFVVWLLTGIWHGANVTFVVWGLIFFFMLLIEKWLVKPNKRRSIILTVVWTAVTLIVVNFGWVIFNSPDLHAALGFIKGMVRTDPACWIIDDTLKAAVREYGFFVIAGFIFAVPVMPALVKRLEGSRYGRYLVLYAAPVIYGGLFLWGVSYILVGSHNPFIYFNF